MDGHSNCEVLEMFNMKEKAKLSRDITRDLLTQSGAHAISYLYFTMLRTMSFLCVANFGSAP